MKGYHVEWKGAGSRKSEVGKHPGEVSRIPKNEIPADHEGEDNRQWAVKESGPWAIGEHPDEVSSETQHDKLGNNEREVSGPRAVKESGEGGVGNGKWGTGKLSRLNKGEPVADHDSDELGTWGGILALAGVLLIIVGGLLCIDASVVPPLAAGFFIAGGAALLLGILLYTISDPDRALDACGTICIEVLFELLFGIICGSL